MQRLACTFGSVVLRSVVSILAVATHAAATATVTAQDRAAETARHEAAPFQLEILGFRFTEPEISLAAPPPERIVFRLSEQLSRVVQPGAIRTTINGEPARTAHDTRRSPSGYNVTIDLRRNPRFGLRSERNELRIAIDGRTEEAAYVVFLEPPATGSRSASPTRAVEKRRAALAEDGEPPALDVSGAEPLAALEQGTYRFRIAGQVSDNRGRVAVTVENRAAALRRPERGTRASAAALVFDEPVDVSAATAQIAVEARDDAGNLTRVLVLPPRRAAVIPPESAGRKAGLVIGVSEYANVHDALPRLKYAHTDASSIEALLVDEQIGQFSRPQVTLLTNQAATVPAVNDALERLAATLGSEDLLFLYVNAHGVSDVFAPPGDRPFYFLFHDGRMSDLPRTGFPMNRIDEILRSPRFAAGRKIVIVDTCHSGGASNALSAEASRGLDHAARALAARPGIALMTSAAAGEAALERDDLKGGVFTHALKEAIRGPADANQDSVITAGELFQWVRSCVSGMTKGRQNPQTLPGANTDLPLFRVSQGPAPAGTAARPRCEP